MNEFRTVEHNRNVNRAIFDRFNFEPRHHRDDHCLLSEQCFGPALFVSFGCS